VKRKQKEDEYEKLENMEYFEKLHSGVIVTAKLMEKILTKWFTYT
jgi:hypothetical protein